MQSGNVATPFGRRPMTLALVRRQAAMEIKHGKAADKWKVLRDASAAMELLKIQSNSLAVLDALLSFYPDNELRQDAQLIVFPSNAQLALRAHAMAGATLRRHIAILVESGLIVRKDSANGKRFARKGDDGQIENAFGFDLSPLLARSEELAMLAQRVAAERASLRKAKESLTICRRDVRKLITAAMVEGADGDWKTTEDIYIALASRIPRVPTLEGVTSVLNEMEMLREEVLNRLENLENAEKISTNAAHIEQHIQNSKPESVNESEPRSEKEQGAKASLSLQPKNESQRAFPLGLVLKACPMISDYAPRGVGSWRDLMSAAVVVRSMLGVSPSAYQDACEALGPENAAVAIACILERANFINSPGGYLRDLTRRSERGEFSLGPMIMALLKANGQGGLRAG
ncbi:plasmid replication protein RepC [Rhizobium sp. MC63]|uniref:Plasmid replication protein RepCd n=6 Tax=Rhizobium TaxID=379 RepID=O33979_RHIEC|nr:MULTISPECIES: plasmid replication protein RepC [Rhizobium]KEC70881.1 replication initiation protein RepC [Rhizobium leguminosarum bv. phaseoli CCGM1]UWU38816.1 plasmid replication protein RepC [Rhizobium leguminosarum bv. phaseoli]AAB69098.2 plasmid replication protein RepCd [Rhizobium etli CFN 42]ANK94416.1 replication initiation protein RepC 2 [Rhizobium sp. N6212]ANL00466.1 replication initiation protein RepC 2 [Rhizobium sp. N621]